MINALALCLLASQSVQDFTHFDGFLSDVATPSHRLGSDKLFSNYRTFLIEGGTVESPVLRAAYTYNVTPANIYFGAHMSDIGESIHFDFTNYVHCARQRLLVSPLKKVVKLNGNAGRLWLTARYVWQWEVGGCACRNSRPSSFIHPNTNRYPNCILNLERRCLAIVHDVKRKVELLNIIIFRMGFKKNSCNIQIGPYLRLTNVSRVFSHPLSGDEGLPNKNNTEKSNNRHYDRGDKHPFGPFRHLLLGVQVLLGPLLFTGGAYSLGNAFSLGARGETGACISYFSIALIFISFGAVCLVAFLPNLEALIPSN